MNETDSCGISKIQKILVDRNITQAYIDYFTMEMGKLSFPVTEIVISRTAHSIVAYEVKQNWCEANLEGRFSSYFGFSFVLFELDTDAVKFRLMHG